MMFLMFLPRPCELKPTRSAKPAISLPTALSVHQQQRWRPTRRRRRRRRRAQRRPYKLASPSSFLSPHPGTHLTHYLQRCAFGPRPLQTLRRFPLAFRKLSFTQQRPLPSPSTPSLLRPLLLVLPPLFPLLPHPGKNKYLPLTKSILPIPHSMRSSQPQLSPSFRAFSKVSIAPSLPMAKLVAARPLL